MKTIVILSGVKYNSMKQRPQHMADYFSSKGYNVLYLGITDTNYKSSSENEIINLDYLFNFYLKKIKDNLYVTGECREKYQKYKFEDILAFIEKEYGSENVTIICSYPDWVEHLSKISEKVKLVYDCLDDWESFVTTLELDLKNKLVQNERKLAGISNLVLASARRLYVKMANLNNKVYYLPNGVWNKDYKISQKDSVPDDIIGIPKPIIFFMGAIAGWVDIDLINYISIKRPKYSFVFVGPEIRESLPDNSNIYYLGLKKYEELPRYLKEVRTAIVPFKVNNLTASVTPLKFYEYLSAGVPTVTTMFPDLLGLNGSRVTVNKEQFLEAIDLYINMSSLDYNKESKSAINTTNIFDWSKLLEPLCDLINSSNFSIPQNKDFVIETIRKYQDVSDDSTIKNQLISLYNYINDYKTTCKLFSWEDLESSLGVIDLNQLSLAYFRIGEMEKSLQIIYIHLENNPLLKYYRNYLEFLLQSPHRKELYEVFLLKLCGRHYEAILMLSKLSKYKETYSLLISLYVDLGEYEIGLNYLIEIITYPSIPSNALDLYSIIDIIYYLMEKHEFDIAEELLLTFLGDKSDEVVKILGDLYFLKNYTETLL